MAASSAWEGFGETPVSPAPGLPAPADAVTEQRAAFKPPPAEPPRPVVPDAAALPGTAEIAVVAALFHPVPRHVQDAAPWAALSASAFDPLRTWDASRCAAKPALPGLVPVSPGAPATAPAKRRRTRAVLLGSLLALTLLGLGTWEYVYLRYYNPIAEAQATLPPDAVIAFAPRDISGELRVTYQGTENDAAGKRTEEELRRSLGGESRGNGIVRPPILRAPGPAEPTQTGAPTALPSVRAVPTATPKATLPPLDTQTHFRNAKAEVVLTERRVGDSDVHIAEITLADMTALRSAFAKDTFGRNIRENTSDIARRVTAVAAINGDFYGYRDDGIIVRNGILYRNQPSREMACLFSDGTMTIEDEKTADLPKLLEKGLLHTLSFGPSLLGPSGQVLGDADFAKVNIRVPNPRTAIGMIEPMRFVFVTVDGRLKTSRGLSLTQLSELMSDLGCATAYNLDGGGSTAMTFGEELVNVPCGGVKGISGIGGERTVSDILYVARD